MAHSALIVGAGIRGQDWIRTILASREWSLAGIVDPDEQALARSRTAHELPVELGFATLADAFARSVPSIVVLATPAELHVEPALEALEAGCGLLVEKPLASSLEEAKRIVSAAATRSVPLVVAQNYRYMRAHRTARKVVQSGVLGKPIMVDARYYRVPHAMPQSLACAPWSVVWGMAVHHLDALRHVLGQEVVEVMARTSSLLGGSPAGATLQALLRFDAGTTCTYSATYESSGHQFFERGQEFYERIVGTDATLHMLHRWLFLAPNGKLPRLIKRGKRARSEEESLLDEVQRGLDGLDHACSGADNLKTMAIIEACIRSSEDGCAMDPRALLGI